MHIRLTIDGHGVDATLDDSATATDFAALLPLTLDLDDFRETEPGLVILGHLTDRDDIARLADADRVHIRPAP
ncbi:cyclophilin-like fold protein [Streptomyces sp. NBC_01334]|uniref:cyclophilin-like fold protein n=1 Tax=Streptomyces sp. NBC_01334 TaxID=2903827 RepID=UPI002E0D9EA7|nr:cyclophilin-like fold protein [Streptomyces sp. NBC_01334]